MKQSLLIFLCLITSVCTDAQELTVKSMRQETTDITASKYERLDGNGVPCALVKVLLAANGAKFEGNVVGNVRYDTGEYWVYMTEGSRELRVKHSNYIALNVNFRDFGINELRPKATYLLVLATPQAAVDTDDRMRYVAISTDPSNCSVKIDGKPIMLVNGAQNLLLPIGEHKYLAEATGYVTREGTFSLGEEGVKLPITLVSALATLSVNCPTQEAKIYVNDQYQGVAPWRGSLAAGTYRVEARLDGHRTQRQTVELTEQAVKDISLSALPPIVGRLNVNYLPQTVEVWLDDKKIGTSPNVFNGIMVGTHTVELKATGYDTEKKQVTISEGETAIVSGSLKKKANVVAKSEAFTTCPDGNHPHKIDLGLPSGTKWACCNLGASTPEQYGDYYRWGETTPFKKGDDETTYPYAGVDIGSSIAGTKYDAAMAKWGTPWQMPTVEQMKELHDNCTYIWTKQNGVEGGKVTGPNGGMIFFPASGGMIFFTATGYRDRSYVSLYNVGSYGYYWSASAYNGYNGHYLGFGSGSWSWGNYYRSYGYPVRAVAE